MPRQSEAEREKEMALIWGAKQLSKRQEQEAKKVKSAETTNEEREAKAQKKKELKEGLLPDAVFTDSDSDDDSSSVISFVSDTALDPAQRKKKQDKAEAARAGKKGAKGNRDQQKYKLHCFIAPGTQKNEVRAVFEDYGEPDVEMRTSQKGNALNKTHFAVLTFKKKTHALFAALHLDGSNQRDTIGMNPMEMNLFLSRDQQKLVRKRAKKATPGKKK